MRRNRLATLGLAAAAAIAAPAAAATFELRVAGGETAAFEGRYELTADDGRRSAAA